MSGHPGELLSAFLDGELSAAERTAVEGHLRECAACARELEELAAVDTFARALPVQAPAGYFEELPGRVRSRVRRPARAPRLAVWAAAAAAAVMAIVVTPLMRQRERSVIAPAAQAVPEAPLPAPATLAAASAPPPAVGFADSGAAQDGTRPLRAPGSEARGRLLERDMADAPAEKANAPVAGALRKAQTDVADQTRRRDALAAVPAAPPAAAAAAPAPSKSTMAENVEAQAAAAPEGARAEPEAEAKKERARPAQHKLAAGGGAFTHPDDRALMTDKRYQALLARHPTSAAEARGLRDAWELFARDVPTDTRADEARVRAIEAGVLAWKLGHDPADLATAQARGQAYLDGESAPQGARVRALLDLPPGP